MPAERAASSEETTPQPLTPEEEAIVYIDRLVKGKIESVVNQVNLHRQLLILHDKRKEENSIWVLDGILHQVDVNADAAMAGFISLIVRDFGFEPKVDSAPVIEGHELPDLVRRVRLRKSWFPFESYITYEPGQWTSREAFRSKKKRLGIHFVMERDMNTEMVKDEEAGQLVENPRLDIERWFVERIK